MQKICFPRLIYYDQEPLLLLNVTEDYFLGVPRFIGQARICKLVERKTFGLIYFPRICFPCLIYCDQEPLLLLNVTEDYFLGVHIRLYQLDTRFVSLQNHLAFPSKVT